MRSWCFDSQESGGVYDREYGSADIREVVHKIVGNGIFMDTDTSLQVAVDSGLQVAIQPGNCFVNGAFGAVDTAESVTFDASASGRYDIVVARFDLSLSYRSIRLAVIKGTEGSSTAPTPTQTASVYDLQLAKVNIRSGATSILQTDITDTRTDTTVCGIVNGVSAQAAALQEQINTVSTAKQDKTNTLATEVELDDTDSLPFYDASASAHKKTLWSNIKAKLNAIYYSSTYKPFQVFTKNTTSVSAGGYWEDTFSIPFTPTCIIASVECSTIQDGACFTEWIKDHMFLGNSEETSQFYRATATVSGENKILSAMGELNTTNKSFTFTFAAGVTASNIKIHILAFR